MASTLYDIENNMIIQGIITKYTASERDVAKEMIERLTENELKNILLLFDRGYPSIKFFMDLIDSGAKFVIRIPVNNYRDRMNPALPDQIITFKEKRELFTCVPLDSNWTQGLKRFYLLIFLMNH